MKCRIFDSTTTDNIIFRLHYRATVAILVVASVVVACVQYFGGAVDCVSHDDLSMRVLNKYCFLHATFSNADAWEKGVGYEVPYPGIDKRGSAEHRVYHFYYYWVSYVLFLQAISFYAPRFFWKTIEGGKIRNIISGIKISSSRGCMEPAKRNPLLEYMISNANNHNLYFLSYLISEIWNFANVVGHIYLTDKFLGGQFLDFGIKVAQFTGSETPGQYSPMMKVFPRLTRCTFHRYGSSGDVQIHSAMCILAANFVIEKIYIFLWFWFVVLSVLSGLVLLYRVITIFWVKFRIVVTRFRAQTARQDYLKSIIYHCKFGNWFVLSLVCKNLDPLNFRDVVNDLKQNIVEMKSDV